MEVNIKVSLTFGPVLFNKNFSVETDVLQWSDWKLMLCLWFSPVAGCVFVRSVSRCCCCRWTLWPRRTGIQCWASERSSREKPASWKAPAGSRSPAETKLPASQASAGLSLTEGGALRQNITLLWLTRYINGVQTFPESGGIHQAHFSLILYLKT